MKSYTINNQLNGIEITFDSKPDSATLDALKNAGFRWHHVKKIWYAKNNAERLALAETITSAAQKTLAAPAAPKAAVINLDGLGENRPSLYGAELAKAIREDLKRRGVSGVTVRARRITYDTGITVTVKATAEDFASLEEMRNRYPETLFRSDVSIHGVYDGDRWIYSNTWDSMSDAEKTLTYEKFLKYRAAKIDSFSTHEHQNCERGNYYEITTAFYNKLRAIYKIANQWNYDNSDSQSDYFDVGYYLDIDIKHPADYEPRESMTEAERAAYAIELAEEEARRAAEQAAWEREQEERRKAAEEAEKKHQAARALIENNYAVVDLPENAQIYLENLARGIGKECTLDELRTTAAEHNSTTDAVITRKVIFTTQKAFAAFSNYLLDDYEFLTGKGGTGSEDVRLEGVSFYQLNQDQRDTVKFYTADCVGVYVGEELKLVSDPEGHSYSRETFIPTPDTITRSAAEVLAEQKAASEQKKPFYFPEDIEKQAERLEVGQRVTVYQCDGWILHNVYAGAGIVADIRPGKWAQHDGIYITLENGGKTKDIFIRNNKECLIYNGIKPALPDAITRRQCSERMYEILNYNELFPAILDYYGNQGQKPIIDTIQR